MATQLVKDIYVVYHVASTQEVARYKHAGWARREAVRRGSKYAYCAESVYRSKVVHKIRVRNLLTGTEIEIDSNTPLCCDPSSETYHSM
jgi:hypothetical protein